MKLIRQVDLPPRVEQMEKGVSVGAWFSNEDPMPRKDAFWAGLEPALARESNPAYTEGMIRAGPITIGEEEIHQEFIRASGPGGQNVNKVAAARSNPCAARNRNKTASHSFI